MTFDVTTHPLLSAAGAALLVASAEVFDATAEAAAMLLRITAADLGIVTEAALTEPQREKGRLAVVRQLNLDLSRPVEEKGKAMERRGDRQVQYFVSRFSDDSTLDGMAQRLADALRAEVLGDGTAPAAGGDEEWALVTSLR